MSKFQINTKYSVWTNYGLTKDSKGRLSTSEPSTGKKDQGVLATNEEITYLGKKEPGFEKEHAFRLADGRTARVHPNHVDPNAKYNKARAMVALKKVAVVTAPLVGASIPVKAIESVLAGDETAREAEAIEAQQPEQEETEAEAEAEEEAIEPSQEVEESRELSEDEELEQMMREEAEARA